MDVMHFIHPSPFPPEEQLPHCPQTEEWMLPSAAHCNSSGDMTFTVHSSVLLDSPAAGSLTFFLSP